MNFFGGLSLSKETVITYPDVIPEGSGYVVGMYLENQFRHCDGNIMFLFPADTEVMRDNAKIAGSLMDSA